MLRKLKEKINLKMFMFGVVISGWVANVLCVSRAYADSFGFLTEPGDGGAFRDITETVKKTGASAYNLMLVIGIIGLVLSTVVLGVSFSMTKNATKKSENKSHLPSIALGAILIFGAISLIGLVQTIATGLNTPAS